MVALHNNCLGKTFLMNLVRTKIAFKFGQKCLPGSLPYSTFEYFHPMLTGRGICNNTWSCFVSHATQHPKQNSLTSLLSSHIIGGACPKSIEYLKNRIVAKLFLQYKLIQES